MTVYFRFRRADGAFIGFDYKPLWSGEEAEFVLVEATEEQQARHRAGYSYALVDGAVKETAPPPALVPVVVSPLQARRALRAAGLKQAVDAFIASQPEEVQEAWEYAVEVRRDNPMIAAAADALGLTAQQVDDLFRDAAKISV